MGLSVDRHGRTGFTRTAGFINATRKAAEPQNVHLFINLSTDFDLDSLAPKEIAPRKESNVQESMLKQVAVVYLFRSRKKGNEIMALRQGLEPTSIPLNVENKNKQSGSFHQ